MSKKLDPKSSWHWQLSAKVSSSLNVDIYDIDLFDTPKTLIQKLHSQGKKVICYFSAGSFEKWRDDSGKFHSSVLGKKMDGWDERWLDIRDANVKAIMRERMQLAKKKGCDGVEPDNVDGYTNDTGFALTAQDQLAYNTFLAQTAHKLGLLVGLKNDLNQVKQLVDHFDFAVNEGCHHYHECAMLKPFILQNKPVLNVEYDDLDHKSTICDESKKLGLYTLFLPKELDGSFRISCD